MVQKGKDKVLPAIVSVRQFDSCVVCIFYFCAGFHDFVNV